MSAALIGGAIAGSIAGAASVGSTALNVKEAARSRRFQKKMYQHRYQYQMDDMRKAGLNPILAYQTGAPGTSGAAVARANVLDPGRAAESGAKAGKAGSEERLLKQQTATSAAQARMFGAQGNKASNEATKALYDADKTSAETVHIKNEIPASNLRSDFYQSSAGKPTVIMQEGGKALGTILKRR